MNPPVEFPLSETDSPVESTGPPTINPITQTIVNAPPTTNSAWTTTDTATPMIDTAHPTTDTATPMIDTAHPTTDTATPMIDTAHPTTDTATPTTDTAHPTIVTATPNVNPAPHRGHTAPLLRSTGPQLPYTVTRAENTTPPPMHPTLPAFVIPDDTISETSIPEVGLALKSDPITRIGNLEHLMQTMEKNREGDRATLGAILEVLQRIAIAVENGPRANPDQPASPEECVRQVESVGNGVEVQDEVEEEGEGEGEGEEEGEDGEEEGVDEVEEQSLQEEGVVNLDEALMRGDQGENGKKFLKCQVKKCWAILGAFVGKRIGDWIVAFTAHVAAVRISRSQEKSNAAMTLTQTTTISSFAPPAPSPFPFSVRTTTVIPYGITYTGSITTPFPFNTTTTTTTTSFPLITTTPTATTAVVPLGCYNI